MITIIEKLHQPYRFTGDGDVIIGGKCPDFVNCNGKKIALEVFYRGHKEEFRGGLERWKRNRSRVFARYGWKIIYFNEKQVNEKYVLRKLGN